MLEPEPQLVVPTPVGPTLIAVERSITTRKLPNTVTVCEAVDATLNLIPEEMLGVRLKVNAAVRVEVR